MNRIFVKEFNRSGYRLADSNSPINDQLIRIKINSCNPNGNRTSKNSNDAYLKINWILKDNALGKVIYVGTSEGISKPARKKG